MQSKLRRKSAERPPERPERQVQTTTERYLRMRRARESR